MNRQQKEAAIASLKENFDQSSASFVVGVSGLTVEELETLRGTLRQQGGKLSVSKVRLMKRALVDTACSEGLKPFLREQIALVFAKQEAPVIAKALCGFEKTNNKFSVVAGCMDSTVLDRNAVETIASLPSREVLLAQVAATMNAPVTSMVYLLHQLIARLVYVLKAVEAKKQ